MWPWKRIKELDQKNRFLTGCLSDAQIGLSKLRNVHKDNKALKEENIALKSKIKTINESREYDQERYDKNFNELLRKISENSKLEWEVKTLRKQIESDNR